MGRSILGGGYLSDEENDARYAAMMQFYFPCAVSGCTASRATFKKVTMSFDEVDGTFRKPLCAACTALVASVAESVVED